MRKKKPGKIINIASLLAERARESLTTYSVSKGAVLQLTRSLAVEWAPYKINVNAIGPGYYKTEMTKPLYQDAKFNKWLESKCPMGRWGKPEELVGTAVFLASAASDFMTGQVLYVDGGWLAKI
jgi:NAD(P)-dependent dehydrogenase (short-subunit alcohol dehydrogenase family)